MNRLIEKAPTSLYVGGRKYDINTDFRDCIKIILAFEDDSLEDDDRVSVLLNNIYYEIPENIPEAAEKSAWFMRCGHDISNNSVKLYDFETDSGYVYAAMLKNNIDLDEVGYMHWWKFMAHFYEIRECTLSRLMYLRHQFFTGKLSKEENAECSKIGWDTIRMIGENEKEKQKKAADYFEKILDANV